MFRISSSIHVFFRSKTTEFLNQPSPKDAVLSNCDRGLVLGRIEGIKQRLSSSTDNDRLETIA